MDSIGYDIPEVKLDNDFTIIYKGRKDESDKGEDIIEIKTSKEDMIRKLRYLRSKSNELKYLNEYYIHDEYHVSTFQQFIESIKSMKIDLNENNYLELSQISLKYEFYELQETIDKFIKNRPDLQKVFDQLFNVMDSKIEEEKIEYEKELIIAKHLDFFLENGCLSKLPNSVLNRIFNSPERILNNHHLLFNFVKEKISKMKSDNENESELGNVEIMISSLDYNKMSTDEILEIIENKELIQNFHPKHSEEKMKAMIDINKKNEERIVKLENEISMQKNEITNQKEEIESYKILIEKLEKKFDEQTKVFKQEMAKFATLEQINKIDDNINQIKEKQEAYEKNSIKIDEINKELNNQKCETTQLRSIIEDQTQEKTENKVNSNKILEFKYQQGKEFDGIMKYLSENTKGNIHDNGTIEITTNSKKSSPKILFDYQENKIFDSDDVEDLFITFDFKDKKIQMTNYSIKSNVRGYNWFHLKNWVIEVSNDGKSWTIVDEHQNDSTLNHSNAIAVFNPNQTDSFYRFIKLRQTGESWNNIHQCDIRIQSFEIFGNIIYIH